MCKAFFSVLFIDIYRHSIWNLFTYLHIYKEKIMCILCHWNLSYIIGLFTQISEAFGKFRSIDSSNSLPTISKSSKLFSCSFSIIFWFCLWSDEILVWAWSLLLVSELVLVYLVYFFCRSTLIFLVFSWAKISWKILLVFLSWDKFIKK